MSHEINQIPVISQNIYTIILPSLNNKQIVSDIDNHGVGVNQQTPETGWVSRGFIQYDDIIVPDTPEINKLEKLILEVMMQITNVEYVVSEMWAVNLEKNQSVIAHTHHSNLHIYPEEFYSVAYYPDAPPGSAELIFSANWCGVMSNTYAVTPQTGMAIIFNSYMTHMTARHKLDDRRLVLSMNLGPLNPNMSPNAEWSVYRNRPVVSNPAAV